MSGIKRSVGSRILAAGTLVIGLACASVTFGQDCMWGSFDTSRINYSTGELNGSAHLTLRGIIASNGGTVAPGTPLLDDAYLADKDVFYTSLLSTQTGTLSQNEQDALHRWIAGGGTLIVTADIFPLAAYESFTAYYGVTNYTALGNNTTGNTVTSHPITNSVNTYRYVTESTFTYGGDALLLGNNGLGSDFMIVMEPGTGFNAGGRILVIGDHNMFTDSYINNNDNVQLANNIASWACTAGDCLDMTLSNFVAGQTARWDVTGADPNTRVAIVYGFQPGTTVVNGTQGYCATFGIKGVNPNKVVCQKLSDANGDVSCSARIPANARGTRVLSQAAMQGTCPDECVSNLIDEVIQ